MADGHTDTVSITYIRREVVGGKVVYDSDKAIKRHLRIIEGKLQDVEDPLGPSHPDMMFIRAGEFWMGGSGRDAEDDEKPRQTIYLDAFRIDKYE